MKQEDEIGFKFHVKDSAVQKIIILLLQYKHPMRMQNLCMYFAHRCVLVHVCKSYCLAMLFIVPQNK